MTAANLAAAAAGSDAPPGVQSLNLKTGPDQSILSDTATSGGLAYRGRCLGSRQRYRQIDQCLSDPVGRLHLVAANTVDRGLSGTHRGANGGLGEA